MTLNGKRRSKQRRVLWAKRGQASGSRPIADSAAASSSLNAAAAVGLRSAYQRAAASASSSASRRYSSCRATAGCRVDAATRLRPGNRLGGPRIEPFESRPNLLRPSRFRVGIDFVIQALNQFARQRGSLFIRQAERLGQELFGIHDREGNTVWISILATPIPATTSAAPTRRARELAAPPMIAMVMTTGGNPTPDCATTMRATCERLGVAYPVRSARALRPNAYVASFKTAWESLLLLANGHATKRAKPGARVDRATLRQIDLHLHDLRHEGACRLLSDGVDIRTIHLMLGHADIKQTQRYLNITDEELRKAMTGGWEGRRQLKAVGQSS
jgi:hypothetical protein